MPRPPMSELNRARFEKLQSMKKLGFNRGRPPITSQPIALLLSKRLFTIIRTELARIRVRQLQNQDPLPDKERDWIINSYYKAATLAKELKKIVREKNSDGSRQPSLSPVGIESNPENIPNDELARLQKIASGNDGQTT